MIRKWHSAGTLPFKEEEYFLFAKSNCKKCYGRGFTGYKVDGGKRAIILCTCIDMLTFRKELDKRTAPDEKVNMIDSKAENPGEDKFTGKQDIGNDKCT